MAFPLKNLELHVSDRYLPVGEQWYEEGRVQKLVEVERNLWVAQVDGREVEIQISPSKVIGTTCECPTYLTEGICPHLIAVLLAVRKEIETNKKRSQKRKTRSAPRKLTTAVLLEQIKSEDLVAFVREYARSNRAFAIALKARFVTDISLLDNKEKYLQLLETTLSAARRRNRMLSSRGIGNVLKVLDELLVQSEDAMAQDYYTDALLIGQAIIEKISPVLNKAESKVEELRERNLAGFDLIDRVIAAQPAPSLIEEIWEYCLQECGRLSYWIGGVAYRFFNILMSLAKDEKKQADLLEKLTELINDIPKYGDYNTALILLKLTIYEQSGQVDLAQELIVEHLEEPDILFFAVQRALEKGDYVRASFLAQQGMVLFKGLKIRHDLEEVLLQVAEYQQNNEQIVHYAHKRFLATLNFDYIQKIKQYYQGNWQSYRNELIMSLQRMSYSLSKRDIIAEIYAADQDYQSLLEYIATIRSLELLKRFDQQLINTMYKEEVYGLYESLLRSFLKHHLGRQTSLKVKSTLQHLYAIGAGNLANRLVKDFRNTYQERHTLMDELLEF